MIWLNLKIISLMKISFFTDIITVTTPTGTGWTPIQNLVQTEPEYVTYTKTAWKIYHLQIKVFQKQQSSLTKLVQK